ncbi:MAG TPA: aminopeptidase P family protein [Anaerolineales bacterium]|nr:aminopeptidase P family protein [Anaerolineales bacterium]
MTVSDLHVERLGRLQQLMIEAGVDLVAIAPTANMRYLLGFMPHPDERLCVLLVGQVSSRFVVPELNADQVEANTGRKAIRWSDAEGPMQAVEQALSGLGLKEVARLAADDTMRADALLVLQEVIRPPGLLAAGALMTKLRMRKSDEEIDLLARAAAVADEAVLVGADACQPGVAERQVAAKIEAFLRQRGAEAVDFIAVASGPNGAFPHHEYGDRLLREGDAVILDLGATFEGYKSDVSRVVHLGQPSAECAAAFEAVLEANRRGRQAAVAGALAQDVDHAARGWLEQTGYGPHFVHRTGHGLGMEIHEPPWITAESDTRLEPGMVFSVEPGVYLQGEFGIRIEDIVVVTEGQARCLTGLDHALIVRS